MSSSSTGMGEGGVLERLEVSFFLRVGFLGTLPSSTAVLVGGAALLPEGEGEGGRERERVGGRERG